MWKYLPGCCLRCPFGVELYLGRVGPVTIRVVRSWSASNGVQFNVELFVMLMANAIYGKYVFTFLCWASERFKSIDSLMQLTRHDALVCSVAAGSVVVRGNLYYN